MRRILCCGISRLGDGSDDQPGRPVGLNPSASQQHSSVSKPVGPVVSNGIAAPPSLGTSPTTEPSVEKQVKPNLWDEARGRLSEEDKAWINGNSQQFLDSSGPGVRGIIDLVDQKRRQCEARRWTNVDVFDTTINLSDLASNAITWLNKFKEVGDTIVQYDPGHAALPWAATRFILQSAISYQEHMAFSLISVEKTTRIVHRCQIYEMLYNCDTANAQAASGLEQALVELYASLLHVLARVGKFLSKDTAWRSIHAVFRPTEGTDLLSELEKFENEVIKEATVCESKRSAKADSKTEEQLQKLQSLLKLEGRMLRVDENVQKALESIELKELIKVLTWISPIEYNLHHDLVRQARTKATCDWLVQQSKFYEWQSETSSITFWLQGFAGSGKTFLTSRVIDLIAENLGSKRNHEGFAFFYCNQTEPTRRQALSVLCSFIRQLSSPKCMSDHLHPKLRQLYFLLTVAARSGCIPICDNLIKRGIPVNPEKYGTGYESPLAAAAANGQAPMVKFLLERGAHVDLLLKDGHYGSALAAARDANVSQILIDNGADINLMLEAGYYGSALAATRDKDIAQLLVDKGADVNMILKAGGFGSALVSAIAAYADDVVELLVEKGADANLPLLRGRYGSALIAAAYTGNVHIAKLLVKHGADVKYLPPVCSYGSALIAASSIFQSNETLLLQFLIEKGAEVDSIAKSGHFGSALAAAAHSDRPVEQCISVMDLLIENGANVNLAISTGIYGSALRAAVSSRRPSAAVCRYLLKKGADVHLHVPHGCYGSPLIAAMQSGSEEVVKSLLEEGVEVDQIPDGEKVVFGTALIAGAYWGFARGVQMLLEAGALVNLQSKVGRFRTALEAVRADLTNEGGVFKDPLWKWRRALGEGIEEARDRMKLQVEELLITHGATE